MALCINMGHTFGMEQWQDQGIVLSVRRHGEHGGIVHLMTERYGRTAGYVRGVTGSRMRGVLEVGNIVDVRWSSRTSDGLGAFELELARNPSILFLHEADRLGAALSACALCDAAMPEREVHSGLFHGTAALLEALSGEAWGAAYVIWEIAFLRELGFSLDLARCASGCGDMDLIYVSPKTGRAVSRSAGLLYKDKLLALPAFLSPAGGDITDEAVVEALKMTGYFLEHWAFTHHSHGIPEARLRFVERFSRNNPDFSGNESACPIVQMK